MSKILLIIRREYLSRVKKKSFLLMTFLVPLLIIGMYALVIALSVQGGDSVTRVKVIDETGLFDNKLEDTETIDFEPLPKPIAEGKKMVQTDPGIFLLYIPKSGEEVKPELYSQKKAGLSVLGTIENRIKDVLKAKMLQDAGIDPKTLESIKPHVTITAKEITPEGERDSNSAAAYGIGVACAILIYMSLFIYGAQVMRGVIEEKTSRIVEVVISSVRPFQLMMGKIVGIGLVGLTQFLLWIILSASLMTLSTKFLVQDDINKQTTEQSISKENATIERMQQEASPTLGIIKAVQTIPFGYILSIFLIYFLGGYLLYSALFAAVGSAVDNETETQQFMFPMTLPLLFTYIMSFSFIINNPDSSLSFWLSIIPLTSPIAMMVRLPFGVPVWELALSIALLVGGFVLSTHLAARVYRVGILMYGKKSGYKELIKWFRYKE